jgi:hypothetical protein
VKLGLDWFAASALAEEGNDFINLLRVIVFLLEIW